MLRNSEQLRDKLAMFGIAGALMIGTPAVIYAQENGSTSDEDVMSQDEGTVTQEENVTVQDDADAQDADTAETSEPSGQDDEMAVEGDDNGVDTDASASITGSGSGSGMFVLEQEDEQISANDYLGQSVLNNELETIGDINDLILSKDGGIDAAVIGVGGFLGIGEKDVAVSFDSIEVLEDQETGNIELMLDATAEQMAQAPEYKTKAEKLAEMRAAEREREQAATEPPAD